MRETEQFLGLYGPDGQELTTTVWGYGTNASNTSYPGPTIVAYKDQELQVFWQNHLPVDGHLLPVDTTLHMANPMLRALEDGFVPVVTHLHGGHSESASDGLPEAWFTQSKGGRGGTGPAEVGADYVGKIYTYDNDQQAAPLWYHDHALGLTRLNVYAGLAGFYLLQDEQKAALKEDGVLPGSTTPSRWRSRIARSRPTASSTTRPIETTRCRALRRPSATWCRRSSMRRMARTRPRRSPSSSAT